MIGKGREWEGKKWPFAGSKP